MISNGSGKGFVVTMADEKNIKLKEACNSKATNLEDCGEDIREQSLFDIGLPQSGVVIDNCPGQKLILYP